MIDYNKHLSIEVPVFSYVKKFLSNNSFLKRPAKLTVTDPIGIFISTLLIAPPKYYRPLNKDQQHYIGTDGGKKKAELITINLAGYTNTRKTHIPKERVEQLNILIDYLIRWEMFIYVEGRVGTKYNVETYTTIIAGTRKTVRKITSEKKNKIDTLIRDFISKYDFNEDELTFTSLKKWYFRFKKKQENAEQQGL